MAAENVKMIQRVFAQNYIRAGSVPLRLVFAVTLALISLHDSRWIIHGKHKMIKNEFIFFNIN